MLSGASFAYVIAPAAQPIEKRGEVSIQESANEERVAGETEVLVTNSPSPSSSASSETEESLEQTAPVLTSYVIPILSETTVLRAMDAYAAADSSFFFSGRDFPGLGYFVEEIKGRMNADGYYWILRINGTLSELGASQARVQPGDTVEWRYEKGY